MVKSVYQTMKSAKTLKNGAILRNLSDYTGITPNKTRWSGKFLMLKRFFQIKYDLITACEHEKSHINIDTTIRFESKVYKYYKMLQEIDVITNRLRNSGHTPSDCRKDLNVLFEYVEEEKRNPNSPLFQCKLGKNLLLKNRK